MSMRKLMNIAGGSASAKKPLTESKNLTESRTALLENAMTNMPEMFRDIPADVRGKLIDGLREIATSKPDLFRKKISTLIVALTKKSGKPATEEQALEGAETIRAFVAGGQTINEAKDGGKTGGKKPVDGYTQRGFQTYDDIDSRRYFGDKVLGDKGFDSISKLMDDGMKNKNLIKIWMFLLGAFSWISLNMLDPRWWKDNFYKRPLITLIWSFNYWTLVQLVAWVGFDVDLGWFNNAATAYANWRLYGTNPFGPDADWSDSSFRDPPY